MQTSDLTLAEQVVGAPGPAQRRAMARDFSWKMAAAGYERLYQDSL